MLDTLTPTTTTTTTTMKMSTMLPTAIAASAPSAPSSPSAVPTEENFENTKTTITTTTTTKATTKATPAVLATTTTTTTVQSSPKKTKIILNWLRSATKSAATTTATATTTTTTTATATTTNYASSPTVSPTGTPPPRAASSPVAQPALGNGAAPPPPAPAIANCAGVTAVGNGVTALGKKRQARDAAEAAGTPGRPADATLRDFRGVQSLRHLWNKRIRASEESSSARNSLSLGKLTKSIGCLVTATTTTTTAAAAAAAGVAAATASRGVGVGRRLQGKRTQSLHDCTRFGVDDDHEDHELAAAVVEADDGGDAAGCPAPDIDSLHREKDNFYKYKTAEQAAKHLARFNGSGRAEQRGAGACSHHDDIHFPATESSGGRAEHIHWPRRQDLVRNRADGDAMAPSATGASGGDASAPVNRSSSRSELSLSSDTTTSDTLTATSSPQRAVTRKRRNARDPLAASASASASASATASGSSSKRGSMDSSGGSTGVAAGGRSARRTLSSAASTARKYSFRTHARTYLHHPHAARHKTSGRDGSGSSTGTGSGGGPPSMVAKLTQQFNEIIQKDSKLLEEVKRNKGVLMSRGGHVYKVIPNTAAAVAATSTSTSAGAAGGHHGKSAGGGAQSSRSSMVQRNIKKFEYGLRPDKPQVPAKSLDVLKRHNETRSQLSAQTPSGRRAPGPHHTRNVAPVTVADAVADAVPESPLSPLSQHGLEARKPPHQLPPLVPLEAVTEEPLRTPAEGEAPHAPDVPNGEGGAHTYAPLSAMHTASNNNNNNINNNINNDINIGSSGYQAEAAKSGDMPRALRADPESADNGDGPAQTAVDSADGLAAARRHGDSASGTADREAATAPGADAETTEPQSPVPSRSQTPAHTQPEEKVNAPEAGTAPDAGAAHSEERAKQRKHKYAKIYEKFRFRSPFGGGGGGGSGNDGGGAHGKKTPSRSASPKATGSPVRPTVQTAAEPEAKLLDAIAAIDQKLQSYVERGGDGGKGGDGGAPLAPAVVLHRNDDFEQLVLPNSSFVHQASSGAGRQVSDNQLLITQAVNVALINSIEGEQMVMEQKELHELRAQWQAPHQKRQPVTVQQESLERGVAVSVAVATSTLFVNGTGAAADRRDDKHNASVGDDGDEQDQVEVMLLEEEERFHVFKLATEEEPIYEPISTAKAPETENETEPAAGVGAQESAAFDRPLNSAALADSDGIYQTVEEALQHAITAAAANGTFIVGDDYESIAGSCEQAPPAVAGTHAQPYDGYELCEPPPDEPPVLPLPLAPPPPPTVVRNTNDELPELPKPKRRLPKSPLPDKRPPKPASMAAAAVLASMGSVLLHHHHHHHDDDDDHHYYADDENIYDTIKGGSHCYESLQANGGRVHQQQPTTTAATGSSSSSSGSGSGACTGNSREGAPPDALSIASNCYESIAQYRRTVLHTAAGSSSGSTLTISSDHKTNSLYEDSLLGGLPVMRGGSLGCRSLNGSVLRGPASGCLSISVSGSGSGSGSCSVSCATSSSAGSHAVASSDNSDEWVDISDTEADTGALNATAKQQFIVVRERSKVHRSPDWSKRVRDKRLHQKKAISCIEDDSDHYYESLSPPSNKRHSTQLVQRTNSHHKRNQDLPRYALGAPHHGKQYSASAHVLGAAHAVSDDYDSFDTDTDDVYEMEEQLKNHHDSGVDIRTGKLPDPPPSTNQVYAIVRKFKNFISSKKSPGSQKHGGSQTKLYENTSQFHVNINNPTVGGGGAGGGGVNGSGSASGNIYENTPKMKSKSQKSAKKAALSGEQGTPPRQPDIYENTEFHKQPAISGSAKQFSTSEKNLNQHLNLNAATTTTTTTTTTAAANAEVLATPATLRSKAKSGKSFKSRLRKSLVGSTFDSKQFSTLTPTRSTFYIEDPSHGGSGELDSGFSEKASSGDLPAPVASSTASNTANSTANAAGTSEGQKFLTVARKTKKDPKSANSQRRRTTIGIRPHEPPPPPPEDTYKPAKHSSSGSTTSWYAECGVFKNASSALSPDEQSLCGSKSTYSQAGSMVANSTSWYAEAGLYQTSGVSVASSSGSSGVSTGNEGGLGDDLPHSMFINEPLYQIYSAAKLESLSRDMEDHDGSTDGYEEIGQNGGARDSTTYTTLAHSAAHQKRARPSALQLVEPKNGPSRTLWSEIPEVILSCILPTLTPRERGLQEAKFEIITSEASYLKSLNLLRSHYMNHPLFRDTSVVSGRDWKALFSYIVPVHECSERLLTELESCWQDNIMLLGMSKRIYAIAEKHFHVYIAFCEHQGRMDRTLRRLKEAKGLFSQNLDLLEASAACCGLNLHSFLMLPMQRITRLPLLIDAVFSKASPNDDEYESWKMTLAIMNKIVTQCNEAANRCEQAYEIERISRQLEFPTSIRALAIAPVGVTAPGTKPRFLVRKGELVHLIWRGDDAKLTFGKKFTKASVFAFLFSDLLVLTKRKGDSQFVVFDYCPRSMLTISSGDSLPQLPTKDMKDPTGRNLILMTLLENHERKTVELVLSCPSVSEQERWLQAMRPPEAETPGEKLYEQWDCPQVIAIHSYDTKEPDALNLEVGDVVNVSRKLPDGWYQGERIRDGAVGWFPGSFTEEVNSAHVRARNLKQRYRLLTFTATYLESQKRK